MSEGITASIDVAALATEVLAALDSGRSTPVVLLAPAGL